MPLVSIVKGPRNPSMQDIRKMVRKSIDLIGGIDTIVCQNDKVLIKPNIVVDKPSSTGATTDPRIVMALIELLRDAGTREVIVGESTWCGGPDTMKAFEVTGMREIVEKVGAKLVDLRRDEGVMVIIPGGKIIKKIMIPKTIYDSDVIISVPVMKTHDSLPVTLGLKNIGVGVLFDEGKRKLHKLGLNQGIVDINKIIRPDLVVVDGIIGMEGLGPTDGDPIEMDLIIAGMDPVAVDAVVSKIMGFDPWKIDHIKLAYEQGIGTMSEISIVGLPIEEVRTNFKRFEFDFSTIKDFELFKGGPCNCCQRILSSFAEALRKSGELDLLEKVTIVCGNAKVPSRVKGKLLLVGDCTSKYRDLGTFVAGCPPILPWIKEKLISMHALSKSKKLK